ncbi:MAG: thioredoxin fold domain-containing protein [Candidatus Magnetomorum sp.]|nr:thioredoxin fold domain-containing protein [Candidatus Magnetomorum sp.]
MKKKCIRIFCLCIFLLFCGTDIWAGRIEWMDYTKGIEKAKTVNKPILLNFYATWCGYCKKMDAETFSDRTVSTFIQDAFVPIQVNSDQQQRISAMYGVRGLPFFWFLTAKAERIAALPGYIPPETFINYLRYIQTDSYQKMDFNQFMTQKKTAPTKK